MRTLTIFVSCWSDSEHSPILIWPLSDVFAVGRITFGYWRWAERFHIQIYRGLIIPPMPLVSITVSMCPAVTVRCRYWP